MKIEYWEIEKVRPYDKNPRRNDKAVDTVAKSIAEFGFRQPIVVDKDGVIVVGHTRYKAALLLKLKTVPVHVAADLTPQQVRAYRLADNRLAEKANPEQSQDSHGQSGEEAHQGRAGTRRDPDVPRPSVG